MGRNGSKWKRIKSFATPAHSYEANVATNEATLVQCPRVSGVPNEATLASFPASPLGVNGAKRAKLSHKIEFHANPSFPRSGGEG